MMSHQVKIDRGMTAALMACALAVVGMFALMSIPPAATPQWLTSRVQSAHTILEMVAILVSGLVITIAWHNLNRKAESNAQVVVIGFTVVLACDVMHVMTYPGMPTFINESSTLQTVFFWLMGRTAELLTLAAIAVSLNVRWAPWASLVTGLAISAVLVGYGSAYLHHFPVTFVEGKGVTPFKTTYEYLLSLGNVVLAIFLFRQARLKSSSELKLLGLTSFLVGVGGVAFTQYTVPSDLQNMAGHLYKVAAYILIYRAIFITSIRAPFDALQESEALVRKSQERWRTLGANLINSVVFQAVRHPVQGIRYTEVSESIEHISGITAAALIENPKLWGEMVLEEDRPALRAALRTSRENLESYDMVVRMKCRDGKLRHMHFMAAPRKDQSGETIWDGVATDITERVEAQERRAGLEAQLTHAQKMESVGALASGIAHDFNNVLAAILGNANMAIDDVKRGDCSEALVGLSQIRKAGSRARALVNQILSFSRRDAVVRTVQPLRPILEEAITLLRSTLPGNVALHERLEDQNANALIDRTQIEQVIMNLCTNAWQALGQKGGLIKVSTSLVSVDSHAPIRGLLLPGRYLKITVEDNGCGMSEEVRQRAFEPFFTTKAAGVGTGLGLSVVQGIVASHDGAITLETAPGKGTRFDIFLPAAESEEAPVSTSVHEGMPSVMGNGERVLYVDDDRVMGNMVGRLLMRAKFNVRVINEPEVAAQMLTQQDFNFDILVTDFNMSAMTGLDLIEIAKEHRPDLPAILMSGYVNDELKEIGRNLGVQYILEKQKSLHDLASAIERSLESSR